jgi:acetyl-CoA acetyltransferase
MSEPIERRVVISGLGQSAIGRRLLRTPLDLTLDACLAAITDAGLDRADIDGLAAYPGSLGIGSEAATGPGTPAVQEALRLHLSWHGANSEGPAQVSAVVSACLAVAAGLARHVLVYRTVTESSGQGDAGRRGLGAEGTRIGGWMQYLLPFGAQSAANWVALYAQRHFHEFGTTREQLAQIALTARHNAGLNPTAVYRSPLSMDDYLSARVVSTPLCLYDCDVPIDGSLAFILSHADVASDLPKPAVRINAVGTGLKGRPSWDQWEDFTTMAGRDAAAHLWSRTELTPADVDVAELYDGFSFLTLMWLEALAFCGRGEGGPFVEGGHRIALHGELPLNTSGGQLSAGRLHGYIQLYEAVVQLRGEAGARQVEGAEVAVAASGGGPLAGVLLLTR